MRKTVLLLLSLVACCTIATAQNYALIDTEYILGNIPAFQKANEQMQAATKKYQGEIEAIAKEAKKMFEDYQAKLSSLSATQKTQKEDEIIAKEKEGTDLQRKYFGPQGEMEKMRKELISPIEDDIYEAVKNISLESGYDLVIDRATAVGIIFANPQIDISDAVLDRLGYSK